MSILKILSDRFSLAVKRIGKVVNVYISVFSLVFNRKQRENFKIFFTCPDEELQRKKVVVNGGLIWCDTRSPEEPVALARYFLPHSSSKPVLGPTRPRVIKWYCPFAAQSAFASGHRYCINVYAGCDHKCVYCYAAGYSPDRASRKQNFENLIVKDIEDLERFDVPPAPVHLSNSTDPLQPLEVENPQGR